MRNYAYTKCTKFHVATAEHRVTDTGKVLKYTLTKTETGWDLNPHPSDNLDFATLCVMKYHKFCFGTAKHRSASGEKVIFSYAYTEKFGTSWDLNPHCSGGANVTTLRILIHLPSTPSLVASLLAVAAEWREKSWLDS